MKIKTLFLLVVFGIITVFIIINWGEFIKPTTISIWYKTIEAPLGLILISLIILLALIFGVYALSLRASLLIKERNLTKELKKAEEIASNAEASRFTELNSLIKSEFLKYHNFSAESFEKILDKINDLIISNKSTNISER